MPFSSRALRRKDANRRAKRPLWYPSRHSPRPRVQTAEGWGLNFKKGDASHQRRVTNAGSIQALPFPLLSSGPHLARAPPARCLATVNTTASSDREKFIGKIDQICILYRAIFSKYLSGTYLVVLLSGVQKVRGRVWSRAPPLRAICRTVRELASYGKYTGSSILSECVRFSPKPLEIPHQVAHI